MRMARTPSPSIQFDTLPVQTPSGATLQINPSRQTRAESICLGIPTQDSNALGIQGFSRLRRRSTRHKRELAKAVNFNQWSNKK
jgi:hypothetical protein